ncbi:MAG: hypothetical protein RR397_10845 [Odoribacter sp.]
MGVLKSALLAGAKGSLQNIIIYEANGQTRFRAKTGQYKDRCSPEQVAQRNKLKYAGALYHNLDLPFLLTWREAVKGTTLSGYNLFIKRNIHRFTPEGEISDLNAIELCCGPLEIAREVRVTRSEEGRIRVEWDNEYESGISPFDLLQVTVYTPLKKKKPVIWQLKEVSARRGDGRCDFQLPGEMVRPVHIFGYFKKEYTTVCSPCFYLGSWEV